MQFDESSSFGATTDNGVPQQKRNRSHTQWDNSDPQQMFRDQQQILFSDIKRRDNLYEQEKAKKQGKGSNNSQVKKLTFAR